MERRNERRANATEIVRAVCFQLMLQSIIPDLDRVIRYFGQLFDERPVYLFRNVSRLNLFVWSIVEQTLEP